MQRFQIGNVRIVKSGSRPLRRAKAPIDGVPHFSMVVTLIFVMIALLKVVSTSVVQVQPVDL